MKIKPVQGGVASVPYFSTGHELTPLKTNILYYSEHTLSHYWFYDPVMQLPM